MTACIGSGPGRLFEARYPMTQPDSPTAVEHAEPVTPDAVMPLGLAFWGSTTLLSAVELGLFAVIGKAGGLHAEELRQATRTASAARERFLRRPSRTRDARAATLSAQPLERPNASSTRQSWHTEAACWRWLRYFFDFAWRSSYSGGPRSVIICGPNRILFTPREVGR
jgi:hypothetical protein